MKIRVVGAELLHVGGRTDGRTYRQTDMTKLIVAFRNFANAPNNELGRMCKEAVVIRFEVILLYRRSRRTIEGNHEKNSCHDSRSQPKFEAMNFRVRSRRDKISLGYSVHIVHILVWIHREGKCKFHPVTGHEGPEGECSSTVSLASPLDDVGGHRHTPAFLPSGKTRYPSIGLWVDPRAGLDGCGKSPPSTGIRYPYRPVRSQLL
jgi:hypothetical protein